MTADPYEHITPEDILRIEQEQEDSSMSTFLKNIIETEEHNLDLFNLEVAKFRLKHGMSTGLIHLYGAMGRLSKKLMPLKNELEGVEVLWENVVDYFQRLKNREEE